MNKQQHLHNLEAEKALIGISITQPVRLRANRLNPDIFYNADHREIYKALLQIVDSGQVPDFTVLVDRLDKNKTLKQVGGPAYLAALVAAAPVGMDFSTYASVVMDFAVRRKAVETATSIARKAYDVGSVLNTDADMAELSRVGYSHVTARPLGEHLSEFYDTMVEAIANPREIWGIPTGFVNFDKLTGGLQRSETFILSGKPGTGKTMLATQFAWQMAMAGRPGVFYSSEMKASSLQRRMISALSGVPARAIKTGYVSDDQQAAIFRTIARIEEIPMYICDIPNMTADQVRADLSKWVDEVGAEWFVYDYLYLANNTPGLTETEATQIISTSFRNTARSLDVAGLIIHSMNKGGMAAGTPSMETLRGSGQLAYDADLIAFLNEFLPFSEQDQQYTERERENMFTLTFDKGRELEQPHRYIHYRRKAGLPMYEELHTADETIPDKAKARIEKQG